MKKIFLFIFLSYSIYFLLIQPTQTPDETGHFENVFWVSRLVYPIANQEFTKPLHFYGEDIYDLFNFGNEDPNLILNFERIKNSNLQQKTSYSPEEYKQYTPETGQAYNPPLYYLVSAVFLRIAQLVRVNLISQFYFARFASSIFYFGTVYLVYKILDSLFTRKIVTKAGIIIFSLNPLLLQSGVGISPDIAVTFFATLFLWCLLLDKNPLILGFINGLSALSKISGLFMVPGYVAFLLVTSKTWKEWLKKSLLFSTSSLVLQIPWFLLNYLRYNKFVVDTVALGIVESSSYSISIPKAIIATSLGFRHTIMHFSGFLGWNDVFPFPIIFWSYTIVFTMLLGYGLYRSLRSKRSIDRYMLFSIISVLGFFFVLGFQRIFYFHPGWGIGGRNILLIFPHINILIIAAIEYFFKNTFEKVMQKAMYVSIFYYYFIIIFVLLPRYYV